MNEREKNKMRSLSQPSGQGAEQFRRQVESIQGAGMAPFKPMLSGKAPEDLSKIQFPVLASPKLDGIRAIRLGDRLVSRSLKDIPNDYVREWCIKHLPEGLDGELLLRDWTAPYNDVQSAIMSKEGEPDFTFAAFDFFGINVDPGTSISHDFQDRQKFVESLTGPTSEGRRLEMHERLIAVPHTTAINVEQLESIHDWNCKHGYEGTMVRSLNGPYKHGRSTTREGYLLKIKPFADEEATVIGVIEEMHNTNEAEVDHLGHTKRSSAKAGKRGKNTLGALVCRFDDGTTFECGTGFTAEQRQEIWDVALFHVAENHADPVEGHRGSFSLPEQLFKPVTVKYLPPPGDRKPGVKPRHPVFKGFRKD